MQNMKILGEIFIKTGRNAGFIKLGLILCVLADKMGRYEFVIKESQTAGMPAE